jgi:hypothetical protein
MQPQINKYAAIRGAWTLAKLFAPAFDKLYTNARASQTRYTYFPFIN